MNGLDDIDFLIENKSLIEAWEQTTNSNGSKRTNWLL